MLTSYLAPAADTASAATDQAESFIKEYGPQIADYGVKIVGVLIAIWISFRVANWLQSKVTSTPRRRRRP